MDLPKKMIRLTTELKSYRDYAQGYNHCFIDWETWIINSLEAIKTDMNKKEIDELIREIKGEWVL